MASFIELSDLLCQHHLGSLDGQPSLGLTAEDRLVKLRALRAHLRISLFSKLPGPLQSRPRATGDDSLTIWDKLQVECADRRLRGCSEDAERLDGALERLVKFDNCESTDVERVLLVLLLLKGSGRTLHAPLLGHQEVKLQRGMTKSAPVLEILPTNHRREEESEQYTQYSRATFESQHCSLLGKDDKGNAWGIDTEVLKAKPGSTLSGLFNQDNCVGRSEHVGCSLAWDLSTNIHMEEKHQGFSQEVTENAARHEDDYERAAKRNLCGALVQSSVDSVHVKLRLPELPGTNIPEFLGIRPPSTPSSDEGFGSLSGSSPSSVISTPEKLMAPWRAAQDYQLCKHRTWDNLGQPGQKTERPYLTEAGPEVFDVLYKYRCQQAGIIAKQRPPDIKVFPDQRELCRGALNVLLGLPSEIFLLNRETLTFSCNPHCRLSGTSTESFQAMIQFFAEAGTAHARLAYLTRPEVIDSFYRRGLILQAFLGSVRKFLTMYQSAVMSLASESGPDWTLLKIRVVYAKLVDSLRSLASICGCDTRQGSHPGDDGDPLPTGIQLISYLYKKCLDCTTKEQYLIHLSLLRGSCGPYFMFIQDWSFHGICNDLYGEFMITVDNAHIFKRDNFYWSHGYKMRSQDHRATVPLFMGAMATDIFLCGKSINLLKLCCPGHFICNVDMAIPRLTITFSSAELDECHQRTTEYSREMTILARRKTITRQQKEAEEKRAKEELAIRAHQDAIRGMEKIKGNIRRRLEATDAKKRRIFQDLKENMQQELLRKTTEIATEKKSDRERMDALTLREESEATLETELKFKAKEDLIAAYEALTEGARLRERRALWRISRRSLSHERVAFLQEQEEQLLKETRELSGTMVEESLRSDKPGTNVVQEIQPALSVVEPDDRVSKQKEDIPSTDGKSQITDASQVEDPPGDTSAGMRDIGPQSQTGHGSRVAKLAALGVVHETTADGGGANLSDVTFSTNQDIEPTLNLLGSLSAAPSVPESDSSTGVLVDLRDFLPEEQIITPDDERVQDTSVEDTLLEIGSVLPESEGLEGGIVSTNPVKMTKSDSADSGIGRSALSIHRHVSESDIKGLLYPSPSLPQRDSDLRRSHPDVTVPSSRTLQSLPDYINDPSQVPKLTGHASDSSIQGMIYPSTGVLSTDRSHTTELSMALTPSDNIARVGVSHHEAVQKLNDVCEAVGSRERAPGIEGSSHQLTPRDSGSFHQKEGPAQTGHATDSTMQKLMYQNQPGTPIDLEGHETAGLVEHGGNTEFPAAVLDIGSTSSQMTGLVSGSDVEDSIRPASRGQPSDSVVVQHGFPGGQASDSTIQNLMYRNVQSGPSMDAKDIIGTDEALGREGLGDGRVICGPPLSHPSDSSAQGLMYPEGVTLSTVAERVDIAQSFVGADRDNVQSELQQFLGPVVSSGPSGHPSDSTIQGMMYSSAGAPNRPIGRDGLSGHPSDSTAQLVMYGKKQAEVETDRGKSEDEDEGIDEEVYARWQEERDHIPFDFAVLKNAPTQDILAATGYMPSRSEVGDYCTQRIFDGNIDALDRLALPVLLERSITAPLVAQIQIVNESVLDYFHVELKIGSLFQSLRRYLFLEGGEFGQCLCDQLFERLSKAVHQHELLSPISLNHILSKAVQYSGDESSDINKKLSFACTFLPKVFKTNALEILDCLEMKYMVDWPSNIVVTDSCLAVYNRIFLFLLKLKRTAWVLKDITHQLDRSAKTQNASSSHQYHQLQIFRHEMQHFVSVMQSYVVNQVIHISWKEFQQNLKHNVHNLDDLRSQHGKYLDSAMHRCLLNKKAAPVMKVITDILSLVLKVRTQLVSDRWREEGGFVVHPNFKSIKNLYAAFKKYAAFLFKVVSKLVTRGYQPHLEEFLMLLNFNDYYRDAGSSYPHS